MSSSVFRLCSLWLLLVVAGVTLGACGPSGEPIQLAVLEPEPGQFLRGLTTIRVRSTPQASLARIMVAVKYVGEKPLYKILKRDDAPSTNILSYDWDTTGEQDGPYQIEVEVLYSDGRAKALTSGKVWVVNQIAKLSIVECQQSPLVAKDTLNVSLSWTDALAQLPATTVELFVQGKSFGKQDKEPYKFSVDLKEFADGQEISVNAVAIRGVYNGATAICNVLIDRQGPRVRFVSPDATAKTVPAKFLASLEIEEEFGVKEVRVKMDGKVVGKLSSPPFQVPVDISGATHGAKVTLVAEAVDRAGNVTKDPPSITVTVDSKPPIVKIISPSDNSQHLGGITFEAEVIDESGVALVDFYIVDEKQKRIDNILQIRGSDNGGNLYRAAVKEALALYGPGRRFFEVVARDLRGNVTRASINMIFGCKDSSDCPKQNPPLQCLGNRCLVPRLLGDQCSFAFSCEPPLVCHFGGLNYCTDEKFGICRADCSSASCNSGFFCLPQKSGPSVCFPGDPCDPATLNCDAKHQCTPWGLTSFVCLPTGARGNGQSCTPFSCTANSGCIKDYVCVPRGAGGVCRRICDLDFPRRDCANNQSCTSFPLRDGGENSIGYCN